MELLQTLLFGLSLCADCFAVSVCSSVTLKQIRFGSVAKVAVSFAVIQTGLLLAGWAFGSLMVGYVERLAHIIGFLLLLYVGGSICIEGFKGESEQRDLNGWKNVILGGIATSIDALAVGISLSMAGQDWGATLPEAISVFVCTTLSVVIGIPFGKKIGEKVGRIAEIAGGFVLIGIGISVLI